MYDSGQDLYNALKEQRQLLTNTVTAFKKAGVSLAKAECEYRVALKKQMLIERSNGTPVTILSDICRGDETVAKLKMQRDIQETYYSACQEKINTTKIEIRILENQMEAERKGM